MNNRSWLESRNQDPYYRRAKREGYRSRSIYKLKHLDSKFNILRSGDRVVDLGASPGGWLQYASQKVGSGGRVLGVDKRRITPLAAENVFTLQADITEPATVRKIKERMEKADVVLSDLSPDVSGAWDVDVARQIGLSLSAIEIADQLLVDGGSAVMKLFQGKDTWRAREALEKRFIEVNLSKPRSSKKRSSEIHAVAKGFR